MSKYPNQSQTLIVLQSFEAATTIQGAVKRTGVDYKLVYSILNAAEYRGELRRIHSGGRTYWIRRCAAA